MFLSVEPAFVGRECNPIFPKNDCVGVVRNRPLAVTPMLKRGTPYYP